MKKEFKAAIPSDDGVTVRPGFSNSRGYLVATLSDEKIIRREMRWNLISEIMTSPDGFFYNLTDCDVVIAKEFGTYQKQKLALRNLEIRVTEVTDITGALKDYLESVRVPADK
jgi:predicted Fe-Mo cluster-binding NifX family protein